MKRFTRFTHQPLLPLGKDGRPVSGCAAHRRLAKEIAAEGTVLLKNDGTLPLAAGSRVCPFGSGFREFFFGGGGAGWVETKDPVSFGDALERAHARGELDVFLPLLAYHKAFSPEPTDLSANVMEEAPIDDDYLNIPEDLFRSAREFSGTALLCISRFSGESNVRDRSGQEGDFLLTCNEQVLFDRLCQNFEKVIVILNVCGPVATLQFRDSSRVCALLYPMFGGGEAGEVLCDLFIGKRYPSGHLQDTLATRIEDYPSTANFAQHIDHVDYEEDIFVGYRYFETMAPEAVVYPFGFGLGYTGFCVGCTGAVRKGTAITVTVTAKNTGNAPGKEVIQLYLSAPQGKLGKATKVLTAFKKTKELAPGQEQMLVLRFDLKEFGSFDDMGVIAEAAFVLEQGEYTVHMGTDIRSCQEILRFALEETVICRRCHSYMAPTQLKKRLTADGTYAALPAAPIHKHPAPKYRVTAQPEHMPLVRALEEGKLDALLASMTNTQLSELLYGHPIMNVSNTCGIGLPLVPRESDPQIPLVPTADGPAGFRADYDRGVYGTFFPCATVLAQTWEPRYAQKLGKAGALEVKENNVGFWLAPGLNIHRNPMCGRNFEYYSEDPMISGVFAAAFIQGVQSQNIVATPKHYCCNNKETNRRDCDSRVSQRALREIYLRGFEIAVKKGKPWAVMTAYNLVNGQRSSSNWEAITGILCKEWRYTGLVMTDWAAFSMPDEELRAGSHVKMPSALPESPEPFDFDAAVADGRLTRETLLHAAKKVLELMDHFE